MSFLNRINQYVWGVPTLLLILGVGVFITIRTGFAQFTLLPKAVKSFVGNFRSRGSKSGTSPYRALCTALAATVGTGNLIGVAGAIVIGGPGAVFWMWICALLGMGIKLAEATLAVRYRRVGSNGEWIGGPMYMIRDGIGKRWHFLGALYCIFGVIACFGVGNAAQVNAVMIGVNSIANQLGGTITGLEKLLIGVLLSVLVGCVLLGGAKRIGAVAQMIVPLAAGAYILCGMFILIIRAEQLPGAFGAILQGAFSPRAATGGMLGSAYAAMRIGASRGVFTNEAGMGTASIAHAGADVRHPVDQGLMGIIEVFVDTIIICTMTALVILCSGVAIPYGSHDGANLTANAFCFALGDWVGIPLALAMCSFAVATIFGWSLYGIRCAQFLFGDRIWPVVAVIQACTVLLGTVLSTNAAWTIAETLNGLMMIPNLIALVCLSSELTRLITSYKAGVR